MVDYIISHDERLRFECLDRAISLSSNYDVGEVLNMAKRFEKYVTKGSLADNDN